MAGCCDGASAGAEITVQSRDPFGTTCVAPDVLAAALEKAISRLRFKCPDENGEMEEHRIAEVHVYRLTPTLSSMRKHFHLETPWVGPDGMHTPMEARGIDASGRTVRMMRRRPEPPAVKTAAVKRTAVTKKATKRTGTKKTTRRRG